MMLYLTRVNNLRVEGENVQSAVELESDRTLSHSPLKVLI